MPQLHGQPRNVSWSVVGPASLAGWKTLRNMAKQQDWLVSAPAQFQLWTKAATRSASALSLGSGLLRKWIGPRQLQTRSEPLPRGLQVNLAGPEQVTLVVSQRR